MKKSRHERYRRLMRLFHRTHPWQLDAGVYMPHTYLEARTLSWWDEVGFIVNRYRVVVWWEHLRTKYADELHRQACDQAGPCTELSMFTHEEKYWKRVGRSRKKVVGYRAQASSAEERSYFDAIAVKEDQLRLGGIEYSVRPSITVRRYSWGIGVELCTPQEVRNIEEARSLASMAKRLIKRQVTLDELFPDTSYDRENWLSESSARASEAT